MKKKTDLKEGMRVMFRYNGLSHTYKGTVKTVHSWGAHVSPDGRGSDTPILLENFVGLIEDKPECCGACRGQCPE